MTPLVELGRRTETGGFSELRGRHRRGRNGSSRVGFVPVPARLPAPYRPRRGLAASRRARNGQSLAEFALILPVLLLVVLVGLDLGRAFFSWVTLNNAARVAANYAGLNPDASFAAASTYDTLIRADASNAACAIAAGAPPQPVFTDSSLDANATTKDLGDNVTVTISCPFRVLTPIIGSLTGNPITISSSATFTIRTGALNP